MILYLPHLLLEQTGVVLVLYEHIVNRFLHLMLFNFVYNLSPHSFVHFSLLEILDFVVLLIVLLELLLVEFFLVVILPLLSFSIDLLVLDLKSELLLTHQEIDLSLLFLPMKEFLLVLHLLVYREHLQISSLVSLFLC